MEKIYLARYSRGSYDDYYTINVFASTDKELVEKWVEKFNNKLKCWKDYYRKFENKNCKGFLKEEYYSNEIISDRFDNIMECNEAFLEEVEFRHK